MLKLALFPVLLAPGCLVAGLYGALHNQISYTVSPDYFYAFKFQQFDIPADLRNRIGASLVGWHASWWMGLVIGVPVLLIALIVPGWKAYLTHSLVAIGVVALTALVAGLSALLFGDLNFSESSLPDFWYPNGVDRVAFARVGNMHDFSYLGGGLGIITASIYLIVTRLRLTRRTLATSASNGSAGCSLPLV